MSLNLAVWGGVAGFGALYVIQVRELGLVIAKEKKGGEKKRNAQHPSPVDSTAAIVIVSRHYSVSSSFSFSPPVSSLQPFEWIKAQVFPPEAK